MVREVKKNKGRTVNNISVQSHDNQTGVVLYLDNGEYKYKEQPLRRGSFGDILIHLFNQKRFSRQTAVNTVKKFHRDNGGKIDPTADYVHMFKGCCSQFRKSGLGIQNVGYGEWLLDTTHSGDNIGIVEEKQETTTPSHKIIFDKEIGRGETSVYVYYYDAYRKLARLKGEDRYPCKIGRTDVSPLERILSQAGTCYPELPHCALLIRCENSLLVETLLHNALKLRHCWLKDAPGKEWFNTNASEIEAIFKAVVQ